MVSLDGSSQMMRYEEFSRISEPSLIMGETVEQLVQMGTLSGMPNPEQLRTYLARPHAAIDRSDSYRVDVDAPITIHLPITVTAPRCFSTSD
jgi:hypothetical protein